MSAGCARVIGPADGAAGSPGSIGVRFLVGGAESSGGFSLVERPLPPRALAAPLHRHTFWRDRAGSARGAFPDLRLS